MTTRHFLCIVPAHTATAIDHKAYWKAEDQETPEFWLALDRLLNEPGEWGAEDDELVPA